MSFWSKGDNFCAQMARGEVIDCNGDNIDPTDLRNTILGVGVPEKYRNLRAISQAALHFRNARIEGRLMLDQLSAPGNGALPALVFEKCHFAGGLTLAHSHFAGLKVSDCSVDRIDVNVPAIALDGACIANDVGITDWKPSEDDGLSWMSARNARIDGDLKLDRSMFRSGEARAGISISDLRHYACSIAGADISGRITAFHGFVAYGGFSMADAHIQGDAWFTGALLTAIEADAFNAQSTRIDGSLMLDSRPDFDGNMETLRRFRAVGPLHMLGIQLGGALYLNGARIWVSQQGPIVNAIQLANAKIKGGLYADDLGTAIAGDVSLINASIESDCLLSGVSLGTRFSYSVTASGLKVAGAVSIIDFLLLPDRYFKKIHLEEFFKREFGAASFISEGSSRNSILIDNARVGSLLIGRGERSGTARRSSVIKGGVSAKNLVSQGDCMVDAQIEGDVNFSGLTIDNGSLLLAGLSLKGLRKGERPKMDLSNSDIAKAIKVQESNFLPQAPSNIRRRVLCAMPGYELVEILWPGPKARMTGHIIQRGAIRPSWIDRLRGATPSKINNITNLTGQSTPFHRWNEAKVLSLDTIDNVREFLQLFCAYVQGDKGAFHIIESVGDLPAVEIDTESQAKEIDKAKSAFADAGPEQRDEAQANLELEQQLSEMSPKDIEQSIKKIEIEEDGNSYRAVATVLYGKQLFQSKFRIQRGPENKDIPLIEMLEDVAVSPMLKLDLDFDGRVINGGEDAALWPVGPALPAMEELSGIVFAEDAQLMSQHGPETLAFDKADINLTDARCDTLVDGGGSAWPADARLMLDRFTYRHAQDRRTISAGESNEKSAWETRYEWLTQDGEEGDGRATKKERIIKAYCPQPFEQAIFVARASGDEQTACELEIRKNQIEAWRAAQLYRRPLEIVGGLAMTGYLFGSFGWHLLGLTSVTPAPLTLADFFIAIGIFFLLLKLFSLGNALLRIGFGYFRKPLNATVTVAAGVLIGWLGVDAANLNDRLVIDVIPAATMVSDLGQPRIGVTMGDDRVQSNIRCGHEINSVIYALDVFIPLIDLRMEGRCAVGVVSGTERIRPKLTTAEPDIRGWMKFELDDLAYRTFQSEAFWSWMKAVYAVLGWIVISLAILTFARLDRRGGGGSG